MKKNCSFLIVNFICLTLTLGCVTPPWLFPQNYDSSVYDADKIAESFNTYPEYETTDFIVWKTKLRRFNRALLKTVHERDLQIHKQKCHFDDFGDTLAYSDKNTGESIEITYFKKIGVFKKKFNPKMRISVKIGALGNTTLQEIKEHLNFNLRHTYYWIR